jgi:hypothetical protein
MIMRFRGNRVVRGSNSNAGTRLRTRYKEHEAMRKTTVLPTIVLSFLTLGTVASALPANATTHHAARTAGEDDDDATTPDTSNGGAGSGAPSGGAATGAGGMAGADSSSALPWLAAGGAGLALVGAGAVTRRRRPLEA